MKKFFLTAVLVAVAATSAFAQLSVGAGYINYASKTQIGSNTNYPASNNGFYLGGDYNIPLVGGLGVAPGVYFSYSGSSDTSSMLGITGTGNTNETYLTVPVNVNYGVDLGTIRVFVFGGPSLQYGLSSNFVQTVSSSLGSGSNTTDNYDNSDYNRFNLLVGGGLGVDVDSFRISFGYDWGLTDRSAADKITMKNKVLHIGISYLF